MRETGRTERERQVEQKERERERERQVEHRETGRLDSQLHQNQTTERQSPIPTEVSVCFTHTSHDLTMAEYYSV